MILNILSLVVLGYMGILFLLFGIGFIIDIYTGNFKQLRKDFGYSLYLMGSFMFGLSAGVFIFFNILNWMAEGQFAIQVFNPNKIGLIFLVVSGISYIIGKMLMKDKEEEQWKKYREEKKRKYEYVTLESGKKVKIK